MARCVFSGDELTLQDIFERHPLGNTSAVHVVLVNFMIDLPWMCRECPSLLTVPHLTVLYGDGGDASREIERKRKDMNPKNLGKTRLHSPPLPLQWGTHHSKIALLIYENCLRVCIRTFNDVFPDVHQKSNAMYLQDFPVKRGQASNDSGDNFGNDFKSELLKYFAKSGGFDAVEIDRYDFSTAAVAIVSSVPGYHSGKHLSDWGQLRLRHLLANHVQILEAEGEGILCQASSFGNLPKKWLDDFHTTLATSSFSLKSKPPLHFVAPSISQIRDSVEGTHAKHVLAKLIGG